MAGDVSLSAGTESARWCGRVSACTAFAPCCLPWPLSRSSTSLFAAWRVSAAVVSTSAPSVWVTTRFPASSFQFNTPFLHLQPRGRGKNKHFTVPEQDYIRRKSTIFNENKQKGGPLCCSGGVDTPWGSALGISIPSILLQHRYDGYSSAGLAQPHLDQAAPDHVSASTRLSAAVLVGARPHPPTFPWSYLLLFGVKATVFACLSSSIPECPRWLLLKKKLDVLERYRSNSPKDKRFLDLVTQQTLWFQLLNMFTDSSRLSPVGKKREKNQNNPKTRLKFELSCS